MKKTKVILKGVGYHPYSKFGKIINKQDSKEFHLLISKNPGLKSFTIYTNVFL